MTARTRKRRTAARVLHNAEVSGPSGSAALPG